MISIKINEDSIRKKVTKAAYDKGEIAAYQKAHRLYTRAFQTMLKNFDEHPVTAEIKAGPRALDYSGSTDGYGNLYSFLGFSSGSTPTQDLRTVISANTRFEQTIFRGGNWYFRVRMPSQKLIESNTEMEWGTGQSWVEAVENGLDNLSHYMFKKKYGRSKAGFQAAYEVNEDLTFRRHAYLSAIFQSFRENFERGK
jgi:hypothetical protein